MAGRVKTAWILGPHTPALTADELDRAVRQVDFRRRAAALWEGEDEWGEDEEEWRGNEDA